jgi:hypothetical protein
MAELRCESFDQRENGALEMLWLTVRREPTERDSAGGHT